MRRHPAVFVSGNRSAAAQRAESCCSIASTIAATRQHAPLCRRETGTLEPARAAAVLISPRFVCTDSEYSYSHHLGPSHQRAHEVPEANKRLTASCTISAHNTATENAAATGWSRSNTETIKQNVANAK